MLIDGEAPAWSPDGRRIAFADFYGIRIHVINLDGSSPAELTDGGVLPQGYQGGDSAPAWSHDGTRIAFIRSHIPTADSDGVYVINADGSGIHRVSDSARVFHPSWLANDQGIAFEALEDPSSPNFHFVIVAVNPDGSNRRLLFSVPGLNTFGPVVAPDGLHYAFTVSPVCPRCSAPFKCQIMVAGSDMQPVQVTHEVPLQSIDPSIAASSGIPILTVGDQCAEAPSWSPDSAKLVFDDTGSIQVINADGSDRQLIAPISDHSSTDPVWIAA